MTENRPHYEAALRQGHSYSWDQRWPEAIEQFERAIEAADHEPAPYAGLGMAYAEMGDLYQALDNYKVAARLSRGDMIYLKHVAEVQERLGQASNGLTWDEEILHAWLPLERWVTAFLHSAGQPLDTTNWLAAQRHLRRRQYCLFRFIALESLRFA